MKLLRISSTTLTFFLFVVLLTCGCTAKARAERHVKRGDEYYDKGEWAKAKLEYLNATRRGSHSSRVLSRLGECFLKEGEIETAYGFLSKASDADPNNISVRQQLASIFVAAGKVKEARDEAEAILKVSPGDSQALLLLADTVRTKEDVDDATRRLESVLLSSPTNRSVPFALGILAHKTKQFGVARVHYEKALSLDPKNTRISLALADLAATQGDTNRADSYYKSAVELAPTKSWDRLRYADYLVKSRRFDEAEKFLEETVEKEPTFTKALNMLTDTLLDRNKLDQAEKSNAKALASAPNNGEALLYRAQLKLRKGNLAAGLAELEELAKARPRDAAVHYFLGTAYLASNDRGKARAEADTAVTLDPKHVNAVLLRSKLQMDSGDIEPAIAELLRLIREVPNNPEAYYALGSAYRKRGTFNDALPIYTALAKALPGDPRPSYFLGLCYRGLNKAAEARSSYLESLKISPAYLPSIEELVNLDISEKKFDSALAALKPVLEKYPEQPNPLFLEAKVFAAQKKYDEAIKLLEKAVELDPSFTAGHRVLVDLYGASGKQEYAITKLKSMIAKNPDDSASLFQLAGLQESAKDYKGARSTYEAILKKNPDFALALNNLANILADQFGETEAGFEYARKAWELAPQEAAPQKAAIADTFGWALWRKGDYARALAVLQSAEKLSGVPEVAYHFGMAHYMAGSETEAIKNLELAVQSKASFVGKERAVPALATLKIDPSAASPETIQSLEKALKQNPTDFIAQLRLAQILEQKKQFEKANQSYQAALAINPRCVTALRQLAQLHAFELNNPERALDFARQAWTLSPDPVLAPKFGQIGYIAGDFKWAATVLTVARRANPDDATVTFYQGLVTYALADVQKARDLFQESAKTGRGQLPLAQEAALLLSYQLKPSNSSQAAATASAALQKDPQFAPGLVVSGLIAEEAKDFNQARARYEQLLKKFPAHLAARRQLGLLLSEKLAQDQQATPLLTQVLTELPTDVQVSKALGKIAYRRADYKEASRLLRDAAITLSTDADLLYHLGMSQYHLNQKQAKESLNAALKLDPKAALAPSAQKALSELK